MKTLQEMKYKIREMSCRPTGIYDRFRNPMNPRSKTASRHLSFNIVLFFIMMIFHIPRILKAGGQDIKFEHISLEHGLSQNSVNCILQDSKGFMWFGTQDGLNRYDGYRFIVYKHYLLDSTSLSDNFVLSIHEDKWGMLWIGTKGGGLNKFNPVNEKWTYYYHDPEDTTSLSNNFVNTIFEDRTNVLWIGTDGGGLNAFDRETDQIRHYKHHPNDPNSLSNDYVRSIYEDRRGVLWVGTDDGLNRYDRENEKFGHYQKDPDNPSSLSNNFVRSIYEDRTGVIWIGTDDGLDRFNEEREEFVHYQHDLDNPSSLSNNYVRSIYEDQNGDIWIGTDDGLNKFHREDGEFIHFKKDLNNPYSLSNNIIRSIFEDRSGILWIGTYGGGVNKFDRRKEKFTLYRRDPNNSNSLSSNMIWALCEDREGLLWIGTDDGLDRYDRKKKECRHYRNNPDDFNSLSNNIVRSIYEDRWGALWIGTAAGLNKLDRGKGQFTHYTHNPGDSKSLSNDYVRSIYEDRAGELWIGTDDGLNRFDRENGKFIHYEHDPDDSSTLSNSIIRSIHEDGSGMLWVGTYGGLNEFNGENGTFVRYRHDPNNPHSISNDRVSIYEDEAGVLWIGTLGGGLNRFDREKKQFTHYTEKEGLPNNSTYGILSDSRGDLWISTNNGLSKFNPQTETFRNYNVNDGLQSNEFNGGAYCKSRTGEMFFGGINGLTSFYPDSIRANSYIPQIVITDIQIFNRSVPIGRGEEKRSILKKSITETEEIELSYKDRVFSFEFAALHYASPDKNEYAYFMEGFEQEWNFVGNRRFATYTNLPPGNYVFKVKGSNNDGVWNEEGTSIRIKVKPPYWQTLWFRILIITFVLLLIATTYRLRTRAIKERNKQLEARIKERTAKLKSTNEKLQQEINERKKTEQALQIEKAYLEQLFESAPEGIVMTDNEGGILRVNNEFTRLFGYTSDETLGKLLDELVAPEDLHDEAVSMTQQVVEGKRAVVETVRRCKDRTLIDVSILGSPIVVDNKLVAIYGIYRDITERRKAEEKRAQLFKELESANQELKDFAYVVSHDLKAPLRAIGSLVDWMSNDYEDKFNEEGRELLKLLIGRVKRMNGLINGILQYSRVGRIKEKKVKINMNQLVGEVIDMVAPPENIAVEIEKKLPSIMGEPTRIEQVIQNLVSNAVKYMDKEKGEIKIGCASENGYWKFKVADNGPGIEEQYFSKIFQMFQTLTPRDEFESTGIGLTLVKKIVELYGGKVWVESKIGSGSTFIFTLPKQ